MPNSEQHVKLVAEISASSNGLISALKQASGAINDTTGDWKSRFSQLKDSTNLISQSVKNLGDLMDKVDGADMGNLASSLGELQSAFGRVQGEVSAFAQQMAAMKNSASDLGMTVEEYQQFALAVENAGMSMDDGEKMIRAMQERIRDFANGVPEAVAQFEKFGISLERVSSNTATSNFREVAQAINETIPPTERATQCMDLFKASIDKTVSVSDQFNKVISQQDKDFVSEKDVQSAISLNGAIEKLGEQLGKYTNEIKEAKTESVSFTENTKKILSEADRQASFFEALSNALKQYNDSLEMTNRKVTNVDDAYASLAKDMKSLDWKSESKYWSNFDKDLDNGIEKIIEFTIHLQKEAEIVRDIMTQRNNAGAPVDTKEVEGAIGRINELSWAIDKLAEKLTQNGRNSDVTFLNGLQVEIEQLKEPLQKLKSDADDLNESFNLEKFAEQWEETRKRFEEAKRDFEKGIRVEFDTKELDELYDKLGKIEKESLSKPFNELKSKVTAYNAEVAKGYPIWQPITRAINKVKDGIANMRKDGRSFGQTIRSWLTHMTHFKNTTEQTNGQLKNASAFLGKSLMQIMGMGSAVAVVAKAWQNVTALVKEYVNQLHEAEKAELYGNKGEGADDMKRVREKRDSEMEKMMGKLKEFADLYDSEKSGGNEARAKRKNLQDELKNLYGFEFKEVNGEFVNLDEQIADKLEELRKKRLKAIDAQIKANDEVREGVDEYIDSFDGIDEFRDMLHAKNWGGYFKMLGHTFTGDVNGANAIKEAQERATRASNENMELAEQRKVLDKTDYSGEWMRIRQGKAQDESDKAVGEFLKKIHEAEGKLDDWKNSLTDTERMKNLRVIMAKYEDAVKSGALSEEARKVAVEAIADMLCKEKEKEIELVKAIEERIKQYKEAFKDYAEAQREVVDAQKDYAKTQKELAREAKAERMARRRERLQKAMGRFGFTPFEGFNLDESSSARRERRRNAQIDASIASKMAKAQTGDRVHWTPAEKERLSEFQRLQRKDKQLEAAQKQMDAADKQKKAAEQLQEAAKAIQNANKGVGDSAKDLGKAVGEMLANSLPKRSKRGSKKEASEIFDNAGMTLKGMDATIGEKASYGSQLDILHRDLQQMMSKTYLVR